LIQRIADNSGSRVLFIKGPVLALQGLRFDTQASVDVDVMVDPRAVEDFSRALEDAGWARQPTADMPGILARHAVVHRHVLWPCEVDLHERFPGMFAPPQRIFDSLWDARTTVDLAHCRITCCSEMDHALIAGLAYLRDSRSGSQARRLRELEQHLAEQLDDRAKLTLAARAAQLGAADTMRSAIEEVGGPPIGVGATDASDLLAWRLRTEPTRLTAVPWVVALRNAPWGQRPRILFRALVPTVEEMGRQDVQVAAGVRSPWVGRLHRLRRGVKALPFALLEVIRISRSRRR
jgi:hypothetical protein